MADPGAATVMVQVCYARPGQHLLRALELVSGATLRQALEQSGILGEAPEIDISTAKVGIHGKAKTLDTVLRAHDRVEVYRSLVADPKDARRRRAAKKTA